MICRIIKLTKGAPLRVSFTCLSIVVVLFLPLSCALDEPVEPGTSFGNLTESAGSEEVDYPVVCLVEEQAKFPGGQMALVSFIKDHFKLPETISGNLPAKIYLSFIVDENGKVSEVDAIRKGSPEMDAAAIEMMDASPNWIPSKQRGKPVKSRMAISIHPHLY